MVTDQGVMEMAVPFLYLMFVLTLIRIPYQVYLTYLQGSGLERQVFLCTAVGTLLAGSAVFWRGYKSGVSRDLSGDDCRNGDSCVDLWQTDPKKSGAKYD